jgi:hypothetical protein
VRQTERAQSAEEFFSRLLAHVDVNEEPDTPSEPEKVSGALGDIQRFALGNYKLPVAEQALVKVGIPAKALVLLARLVSGRKN